MSHYLVISGEANWAYSIELEKGTTYRIGRAGDNDVVIKDQRVSSYHSRLMFEDNGLVLTDLESRNGTWVNGQKVRNSTLRIGDRIRIGHTHLQYVRKLDPANLSSTAILSPRLSQPLLKTQIQRLRDLIGELNRLSAVVRSGPMNDGDRETVAKQMDTIVESLKDVEIHTRTLTGTNHFHEIFHKNLGLKELFLESLRFVVSAVEAENGALVLKSDASDSDNSLVVEATIGLSVSGWPGQIPEKFHRLIEQVMSEGKTTYIPTMYRDSRVKSDSGRTGTGDHRSILVAPIASSRGKVLGAAYFDNPLRPQRLEGRASHVAEGCLKILADHLTGDAARDQIEGRDKRETQRMSGESETTIMYPNKD
ncbi:FHA domain-containing protein [bacterium]|nr:FHA domain-containing protein [bacterium]